MRKTNNYTAKIKDAVSFFWRTKEQQQKNSGGSSNRGAVVGGKQMDGFIELLKKVAIDAGIPADKIITKNNYVPGYFRSSKDRTFSASAPRSDIQAFLGSSSEFSMRWKSKSCSMWSMDAANSPLR